MAQYELIIAEKRTGKAWDAAPLVQTATFTTNRTGSPGTFKFTINAAFGISFLEGDPVRFSVDASWSFWGRSLPRAGTAGGSSRSPATTSCAT